MSKQHTKDKLAAALREIGLTEMAEHAADGMYDEFASPLAMPLMALIRDLTAKMHACDSADAGQIIAKLRKRVVDGEFDASNEESDEWANSPEGHETFSMLVRNLDRKR